MPEPLSAVVLLSGGLDSATVLAIALAEGYVPRPLTFDYGQRHRVELKAARAVCKAMGLGAPKVIKLDLRTIGGSALTADIDVPKDQPEGTAGIPVTYVPARNTLFLSYALAYAEASHAHDIFIGVNAIDYSGYPDCRPEFVAAFETLANLATREGVEGRPMRVHTPLISLTKAEIIRRGMALGVDYSLTHSCYDPVGNLACGRCDSCNLRRMGFEQAGIADPTRYSRKGA
jgi:7-cyano-7-deazaguanine synthase